jgi:hypothetical protein
VSTQTINALQPVPRHLPARALAARWRRWESECAYLACKLGGGPDMMALFRERHLVRCQRLIAAGIHVNHPARMEAQRLDDPTLPPAEWEIRFQQALAAKLPPRRSTTRTTKETA